MENGDAAGPAAGPPVGPAAGPAVGPAARPAAGPAAGAAGEYKRKIENDEPAENKKPKTPSEAPHRQVAVQNLQLARERKEVEHSYKMEREEYFRRKTFEHEAEIRDKLFDDKMKKNKELHKLKVEILQKALSGVIKIFFITLNSNFIDFVSYAY